VPNFAVDYWTMCGIDQKCQVIIHDCVAIGHLIGTGDVLHNTTLATGMMPITSENAAMAQRHLQRIGVLAQAIEDVPNFGPDLWSMRQIDVECREMAWHAQAVWPLVSPPGTGHV
jgi:hypothetical protein